MDGTIADALHDWARRNDAAVDVLRFVTDLGAPGAFYVVAIPVVVVLCLLRRFRVALWVAASVWLGGCINIGLKNVIGRDRPSFADPVATASGHSLPSGHALLSTVVYGAIVVALWPRLAPRWRAPLVVLAAFWVALIGFTRMALGVHYLSDVVVGVVVGAAWLAACTRVIAPFGARSDPRR